MQWYAFCTWGHAKNDVVIMGIRSETLIVNKDVDSIRKANDMDMEKVTIPWRNSTRKEASDYEKLPDGIARGDYAIPFANVGQEVVTELLTRAVAHVYNNEAISACIRGKAKAEKDGTLASFDPVAVIHKYRMDMRARILDGTFGKTRGTPIVVVVDPITAKMQSMMHLRLLAIARKQGRPDFPDTFDATTAKIVVSKSGRTLGQMVSDMIAADDGKIRKLAQEAVEKERAEREAALAAAAQEPEDEDAAAMFDDEPEEAAA